MLVKGWGCKRALRFIIITAIFFILEGQGFTAPPLMDFEGVGGAGIVPGVYLINPPKCGQLMGKPAVSHWSMIGESSNVYTNGFAFSFLKRFEAGYVLETADFGRLNRHIANASNGALQAGRDYIFMHNFHLKTLLLNEMTYIPAFGVTGEFKYNSSIDDINDNLGHALDSVGYDSNKAVDFDFSISKTISKLFYYPCIINANIRLTRAHCLGFLGFSNNYTANAECSAMVMFTPKFVAGVEVRQQNDEYDPLPLKNFDMEEDTFWDVHIGILPNQELSMAFAFCRYGRVSDQDVNFFVFNIKYDF